MADLDLKSALDMFTSGAQDLMFSRALADANDQVQQIKSSELNEQKQRAQMQQVSNQLVMHMAQLGVPESTMAHVSQSMMGPQMRNANEMAAQATLTGNTQLMNEAKQQQAFEQNPEYKKTLMAAKWSNPNVMAKQDEARKEFDIKQFAAYGKDLDHTAASSRSAFGVAGITDQRASRLTALIGNPENMAKANDQDLTLIAEGLSNMVKNGVATEKEIEALVPNTRGSVKGRALQWLTNHPESTDRAAFIDKYKNIIGREKEQADKYVADTILKRATNNLKLKNRDEGQYKMTTAKALSSALGVEINPDDIGFNSKNGVTLSRTAMKEAENTKTGLVQVMVKNRLTGQMEPALQDPVSKKLYPVGATARP